MDDENMVTVNGEIVDLTVKTFFIVPVPSMLLLYFSDDIISVYLCFVFDVAGNLVGSQDKRQMAHIQESVGETSSQSVVVAVDR